MFDRSDDDFDAIVDQAVKGSGTNANKLRDRLGDPDIVGRTVAALCRIVDRIDEHLQRPCDEETLRRRAYARDVMWERLVWYETLQRMHAADADE